MSKDNRDDVMGKPLTDPLGLWFPYNGDQWVSKKSPSVPKSSSLQMPSTHTTTPPSSSGGFFVWSEPSCDRHCFSSASDDTSYSYPRAKDVYI